jgi:hypothetical protein
MPEKASLSGLVAAMRGKVRVSLGRPQLGYAPAHGDVSVSSCRSGLRTGFANLEAQRPHTTFSVGISHDFDGLRKDKPLMVRLSVRQ